jgi:hypothetical protein
MSEAAFTSLCTLTVFFEDPFWVGVFERLDERSCSAAWVVFGGEPSNPEVYTYLFNSYRLLELSASLPGDVRAMKAASFKRRQREARRTAETAGFSSKAQEALRLELEKNKQERRESAQRKFELRQ